MDPNSGGGATTITRWSSIPTAVKIPNCDHPSFELLPLLPGSASYTSLKDLLPPSPSSVLSPTPTAAAAVCSSPSNNGSGYEISIPIRNRLVKQAAWAYLQSAASSYPSSTRSFCLSGDLLRRILAGFGKRVVNGVTRLYDWLVEALWLLLCS